MAATAVTISDTKQSILDGTINGAFNENRTIFRFKDIKYTVSSGKVNNWTLLILLSNAEDINIPIIDDMLDRNVNDELIGCKAIIQTESGQEGGKIRKVAPTIITEGKHIGAINETNIVTQAFRDALGLYNKKLKKVATNVIAATDTTAVAATDVDAAATKKKSKTELVATLGPHLMPPPMLVQNINNNLLKDIDFENGITLQRKLNGVHYITFRTTSSSGTDIIKYSRSGLLYSEYSMPKITIELETVFNNAMGFCSNNEKIITSLQKKYNIPDIDLYRGATPYFAGELYKHGIPLNIISGQARKETTTIDLEYHIFDVFFPLAIERGHNMISKYRQLFLDNLFQELEKFGLLNIKRVENIKVHSMDEINELVAEFIKAGYEGGIVRKDNGIYRYSVNNYHSKEVLKIKPTFDDEFPIVGFTQGSKGKDLGALIWICSLKDDPNTTFHVVPNMPIEERKQLYKNTSTTSYIGKLLTVSYAELSSKKIPLQPKGVAVRDYE
jgi:hypothetical protein